MSLRGVLNIDKPTGITSYDVIRRIKQLVHPQKPTMGHAGTLDPLASGVLLVLVGEATKASRHLMGHDKEYEAEVLFGTRTDTDDLAGQEVETRPVPGLSSGEVSVLLGRFTGDIEQVPPRFSALKQAGTPQYRLAREGREVASKPRAVTVRRLELLDWTPPRLRLRALVSSGTYIRSLARDIGEAAGSCATLAALRRTTSGGFRLEDSVPLDELTPESVTDRLVPVEDALADMTRVPVTDEAARRLLQGQVVPVDGAPDEETVLALTGDRRFLAFAAGKSGKLRTRRVIRAD